jgi:hypothetical protein
VELFEDEIFNDVAKNGHLKVLELAHSTKLGWYSRKGQNQSGALGLYFQQETKQVQFELYKNVHC